MRVQNNNQGFTIVELMIATTVFSVILLICTFGIIQVGKTYYKGTTAVRTQNVARDVMDNISQSIQFGSSAPNPVTGVAPNEMIVPIATTNGAFCAGNIRYRYNKNTPVTSTSHAFQVDNNIAGCSAGAPSINSRELLAENMRITKLNVAKSGSDYTIMVKVTYGDADLINLSVPVTDPLYGNCRGGTGDQFCATSELQTTVHRRLTN